MQSFKITCIIHSLGIGGMERVMAVLLRHFGREEDLKVDLILIGKKREVAFALPDSIRIHRPAFKFEAYGRSRATLKTMYFLRKKVRDIKPDTVLSFGEMWNNLVLLSLAGLPYPVFISDRSQPNKHLGRFHNFLRDRLYPGAKGYIAQTQQAARIARDQKWNRNIKVIGNPVRNIKKSAFQQREKIVVSVGRLIATKHFDALIRMFVEIDEPGWQLIILGGNAKNKDLLSELNQLVKTLGAESKVHLAGEVKNVEAYLNRASVFAFASSSEGFPNAIAEALSAGLPVVAYDCVAGPSDLIEDGENGFLVKTHDQHDFKAKLQTLMRDNGLREKFSKRTGLKLHPLTADRIAADFLTFITS
ncbi:glycosyltransferase [Negadavirga shengliensis]|uniref:Glycosyltransferase n=1 Tax=Negadavirga shengliensis TaxID=1389218 RepID=A0ABV9SZD0_9BACT